MCTKVSIWKNFTPEELYFDLTKKKNMANSEDNTRNVADYFVVAGLPKENPQLLDEYSLEVNLKPSAYQDPITDITVST